MRGYVCVRARLCASVREWVCDLGACDKTLTQRIVNLKYKLWTIRRSLNQNKRLFMVGRVYVLVSVLIKLGPSSRGESVKKKRHKYSHKPDSNPQPRGLQCSARTTRPSERLSLSLSPSFSPSLSLSLCECARV